MDGDKKRGKNREEEIRSSEGNSVGSSLFPNILLYREVEKRRRSVGRLAKNNHSTSSSDFHIRFRGQTSLYRILLPPKLEDLGTTRTAQSQSREHPEVGGKKWN